MSLPVRHNVKGHMHVLPLLRSMSTPLYVEHVNVFSQF